MHRQETSCFVKSCSTVDGHPCRHRSFETLLTTYKTTRCHETEVYILNTLYIFIEFLISVSYEVISYTQTPQIIVIKRYQLHALRYFSLFVCLSRDQRVSLLDTSNL